MIRTDNRLFDTPMLPVQCGQCGASTLVRKSSWQQTSIQWDASALATCAERENTTAGPGPNDHHFTGCDALRRAIADAAASGALPIADQRTSRETA